MKNTSQRFTVQASSPNKVAHSDLIAEIEMTIKGDGYREHAGEPAWTAQVRHMNIAGRQAAATKSEAAVTLILELRALADQIEADIKAERS